MSPLHAYLDLEPQLVLIQDEFQFSVRQSAVDTSSTSIGCSYVVSRSTSSSSSSRSSNFSFSVGPQQPHGLHIPLYADQIFHNGKIRPLHDPDPPPPLDDEAITDFPLLETMQVQHEAAPAQASISSPPSLTFTSTPLAKKKTCRITLSSFLPLRKVFHAEDECSSPSSKAQLLLKEPLHGVILTPSPHEKVSTLPIQPLGNASPKKAHVNAYYMRKATSFVHNSSSIHGLHYHAQRTLSYNSQRASKANTPRRTYLPYRRGILACIGY